MNTAEYPALGAKVKYIRTTDEGKILDGVGHVQAIFLDPNKRIMAQVKDIPIAKDVERQVYNIDFYGINPNDQVKKEYGKLIKDIQATTLEGNKLAKEVVDQYNEKVEQQYSSLLGAPVEFE